VVLLNLDTKILFKRLTGRRSCAKCGKVVNIYTSAASDIAHGRHAEDGGELIQRPDDKEEVIGKRLEVYEQSTKPLVEYYTKAGLLRIVNADAEMDAVFAAIQQAVAVKQPA
jgi:adenylate kinase